MATMTIQSRETNFSYIINKNPQAGMTAKSVKKGYMFGYFGDGQYNIAFFDGADEVSFPNHIKQEFEYLDCTRYNSPLFITTALKSFFSSALNTPNNYDHAGKYSIKVTSVEIRRFSVFDRIKNYFEDFKIETELIDHETENPYYRTYRLEISCENKTLYKLLNFAYMLSFFIIALNRIEFDMNLDIIKKVIKAANIVSAPYYIKYLIKFFAIKNDEAFEKVKDDLNYNEEHKFDFKKYSNSDTRFFDITSQLIGDKNVVDIGCGEGNYLKVAEKISKTYYAIDTNEECRGITERKAKKRNLTNVKVLENIDAFLEEKADDYIALMSEVIEHNEIENVTSMLDKLLSDEHCKKILITTPNKDFNQFYLLKDDEKRHKDHVFEFKEAEAKSYFESIASKYNCKLKIKHLGDEVDGIPTTLFVSLIPGR